MIRDHSDDQPGNDPAEQANSSAKTAESSDGGAEAAAAIAFLQDRVARLNTEKEELRQTLVRRQADFENYRKRIERERQDETRRGVQRLMDELLPVLDAFERALASHRDPAYEEYRKGLELIYKQLWETLARHGLVRIDAAGKQFDPNFHLAIERVETNDHADGAVIQVMQPGYLFHGKVLRPASVRVASAPAGQSNKLAS